ncbi:hypothetical protein FE839_12960 [Klebsiella indica]|uniref:Uncharacterized protein n=1 Tax=Klebsiella indica TaxID=2582917 RepID=A0A5R9LH76_9ENTR|nr:hypothetical protein FE839_12960 [Klebsiella indica]
MKSQKRALRRHHAARLKSKRRHYRNAYSGGPVAFGKVYHTPCPCSCWMCGHQRRYHGMGRQEIKARARCS